MRHPSDGSRSAASEARAGRARFGRLLRSGRVRRRGLAVAVEGFVALACAACVTGSVAPSGMSMSAGRDLTASGAQLMAGDAVGGPARPSDPLVAEPFDGMPTVGALVSMDEDSKGDREFGDRSCTASVVDSPGRDLVMTAAHCVDSVVDEPSAIGFVPEYRPDGAPVGVWIGKHVVIDPRWASSRDPDYDVGFLIVEPVKGSTRIQDATGANELAVDAGFDRLVQVVGYPAELDRPVVCRNYTTRESERQLRFDCANFSGGTSGSPFFLLDDRTGKHRVAGLIGGYQEGGETSDISYSAYFGSEIRDLYREAARAG
jgi:V8-like Glu-specific endopeptidase